MMSFATVFDLETTMDPLMPSMNHGSAGNENPTHVAKGQYKSTLSFVMTGQWEVTFRFSRTGKKFGTVMYPFDLERGGVRSEEAPLGITVCEARVRIWRGGHRSVIRAFRAGIRPESDRYDSVGGFFLGPSLGHRRDR